MTDEEKQLAQLLGDSNRLHDIEQKLTKMEQNFDVLIDLLDEMEIVKGPDLKINLESYDIKQLNLSLSFWDADKIDESCNAEEEFRKC